MFFFDPEWGRGGGLGPVLARIPVGIEGLGQVLARIPVGIEGLGPILARIPVWFGRVLAQIPVVSGRNSLGLAIHLV
jgi:hypothetical protein